VSPDTCNPDVFKRRTCNPQTQKAGFIRSDLLKRKNKPEDYFFPFSLLSFCRSLIPFMLSDLEISEIVCMSMSPVRLRIMVE